MNSCHDAYLKSLSTFKTGVNSIREQVMRLKMENTQHTYKAKQFNKDRSVLQQENENLFRSLKENKSSLSFLAKEKQGVQDQLHTIQEGKTSDLEIIRRLKDDLKSKNEEVSVLRKHLETYEDEMKHSEQDFHLALQDWKAMSEKYDILNNVLVEKSNEYEGKFEEGKSNEEKMNQLMESMTKDSTSMQQELNELRNIIKENEISIKSHVLKIETLTDENQILKINAKNYKKYSLKAQELKTSLEEKVKEQEEKSRNLCLEQENNMQDDFNKLNEKYKNVLQKNESLQETIDTCHLRNEKLVSEVQELTLHESSLNNYIGDLTFTNETKSIQIERLEGERQNSKSTFLVTTSELENLVKILKRDMQISRGEVAERREEISSLKQETLAKDFKIQELERCIKEKVALLH